MSKTQTSSRRTTQKSTRKKRLPFECLALVLQGGGALGSYQAGVYEALHEADVYPDWIAGISIGAINAAIIAPLTSTILSAFKKSNPAAFAFPFMSTK